MRLMQSHSAADRGVALLEGVRRTNRNPHMLYSQVGYRLGLILESTVRDAFVTRWAETYPDGCRTLLAPFTHRVPREAAARAGDVFAVTAGS